MNLLDESRKAEITRLRSDLAAALERERMALWALALECPHTRCDAMPAGFLIRGWGLRHQRTQRGIAQDSTTGLWLVDSDSKRHPTALTAILSIDPTAKPPEGWNP